MVSKKDNDDLMKFAIEHSTEPQRDETYDETLARWKWFDDEDGLVSKPAHYDDKMVKQDNSWKRFAKVKKQISNEDEGKKMTNHINRTLNTYEGSNLPLDKIKDRTKKPLLRSPNRMNPHNKDSYISSGKPQGQLGAWDQMKATANTPEEKKEIKEQLNREYKRNKQWLTKDELKIINKHPDQIKEQVKAMAEAVTPKVSIEPIVRRHEPIISSREFITKNSSIEPGLSADLVKLQKDIADNVKYVLEGGEDPESRKNVPETSTKGDNDR